MPRARLLSLTVLALVPSVAGAQRAPVGPEFRVNTFTTGAQEFPAVAADFNFTGNFVVVWASEAQDGSARGVFGQRYAGMGFPEGSEFRVNTYTTNDQARAKVAATPGNLRFSGPFVVVWHSNGQDGSSYGAFGQLYDKIVPVELMQFGVE